MKKLIIAMVAIPILLLTLTSAVNLGYQDSVRGSGDQFDFNETITVDEGNVTQLGASGQDVVYSEVDDVVVTQNGNTFEADGNYTWYEANGTIKFHAGSDLTDGSDANVAYHYNQPENQQQLARDIGMIAPLTLGDALTLIGGIALLLGAIVIFGRSQ